MACVSRSRLGRGRLTQFWINFLRYRTGGHFRSEKKNHPEMGQAPTSQSRPRDTDHLRPSNLAARTLSLVEHALSKFSGDPCPVRRVLSNSSYLSLCAKSTFFPLLLNRTREARALCGCQHHEGVTCLVFCSLER